MQILIADDDPVARRMIEAFLSQWGFETVAAEDGNEAWKILQQKNPPRLAILDWMMPGMDGLQICREVRKLTERPYIYLLLLTGKDQKDDIAKGLEAGADEYLCKPFDPTEVKARVRSACRVLELHERMIATLEKLRIEVTHDTLTSVWNRSAILDILQRELARSERESSPVSVVIADVDHFKQINDKHGHQAGDAALREVTVKMQSQVRPYDSLGRYGGEEFLVVAPGCDLNGGKVFAERLRVAVSHEPIETTQGPIPVTVSLGVASNTGIRDADSLIHAADGALYRAKNGGRNRVELACFAKMTETIAE